MPVKVSKFYFFLCKSKKKRFILQTCAKFLKLPQKT